MGTGKGWPGPASAQGYGQGHGPSGPQPQQGNPYGAYGAYGPPPVPAGGPYGPDPHGIKGPQRGRKSRKVAVIVTFVALGVVAALRIALLVLLDDGTGSTAQTPSHVALPRTLDKQRLVLAEDFSDRPGLVLPATGRWRTGPENGMKAVAGRYEAAPHGGARQDTRLTVHGFNGHLTDPAASEQGLLTELEGDESSAGKRSHLTPKGSSEELTCEVMLKDKGASDITQVPVCAWADRGSVVAVEDLSPSADDASHDVGLPRFAARVSRLRGELRSAGREKGTRTHHSQSSGA